MPERADALDRVRLGDAGILIVSPEQLRSVGVRRALDQREIGTWILDEARAPTTGSRCAGSCASADGRGRAGISRLDSSYSA